jgi:hypothetical protein
MKTQKIVNWGVSYHWSDNTYENTYKNENDPRAVGDLYLPPYLICALEKYAKELEAAQ